jgi:CBS domain-containing protein
VQVRDVMTDATVTDSTTDTLRSAAERRWRQQTGSLLVMDSERLAGIITERDLLRAVALGADAATATVDEAMTTEVFTVPPDMPLLDAAREMATRWIRHPPVEDNGRLVGMVSMRDVTGSSRRWRPEPSLSSTSSTSSFASGGWPASSRATWTRACP